MPDYPLLFRTTHAVRSGAFEARVTVDGRVLMAREDREWWCHGVDPGGMTENGDGPAVAYERFRLTFRQALDDLVPGARGVAPRGRDRRTVPRPEPDAPASFGDHDGAAQGVRRRATR